MATTTNGGDVAANELMESLVEGESFTIPEVDFDDPAYVLPIDPNSDFYKPVTKLTNKDLTTGVVGGDGTFDVIMAGYSAQLRKEYDSNRISGAEYTKAFTALAQSAMGNAVQFLLGRDAAFWQAQTAQIGAVTARIQMETAKAQYYSVALEALTNKANYALTKLKLATEDVTYANGEYQLNNLYPQQLLLLKSQTDTQHAQVSETLADGSTVTGLLGMQKSLYAQQIDSYKRDAETKAAKIFSDSWTVQKTIDEGLVPPDSFTNATIDAVMQTIIANNDLE